jgi:FPC/CPF motif-containing protein YcgG
MNQVRSFAKECVSHYANHNILNTHDLPDFVQNEFAGIIMCDNEAWAAEATGPDNPHWSSKMLPALTRYLKNSTDKDEAIEFNTIWRECVTDYMNHKMQELLDEAIT